MGGGVGATPDSLLRRMHAAGLELRVVLAWLDGDPLAARLVRAVQELDLTVRELQDRALARAPDRSDDSVA
ncbi:hypothetical protein [Jiangella endophytica]|uniref:hypothetical protein n=1 Tax=Jiangella endophytica TaxID=1623398 RepID=UPI00130026EA|nr:hypothetical protein [Jiangella endophytica]